MSFRRYLSFLILFLLPFHALGKVSCKKQWGKVVHPDSEYCKLILPVSSEPSSILINGAQWRPSEKSLSLKIRLENSKLLGGFKLSFYSRGKVAASYTLPLYTDLDYNILQDDLETWLSIPFSDLDWEGEVKSASDTSFDGLSLYLSTKNGDGDLSVDIQDIQLSPKPKKGKISITFDDGYIGNFAAAKIMKPLGLVGTAYLIPNALNLEGHLSEEQAKILLKWGWSLSSHLTTPVTELKDLEKVVTEAKAKLKKLGGGNSVEHFALPLGKYNKKSLDLLKKNFSTVRLAGGKTEVFPVRDKFRLKTINVIENMSPQEVFNKCEKAIKNGEWAILMFHYIDRPSQGELNYSSKKYETLMKLLAPFKDSVLPIDQVL
ncbi:MAG: polysaccharide deacetylase family protein [Halobacteriovoraceae bacterium]|nr:polysaccharide deacetylase family protein [Halobacteriovoraceae bacterium]